MYMPGELHGPVVEVLVAPVDDDDARSARASLAVYCHCTRNLLGCLETRLAQMSLNYLQIDFCLANATFN